MFCKFKLLLGILSTGCLLSIASCTTSSIIDEFIPVPNQKWDYEFNPEVTIHVPNIEKKYRVYLNLRHNQDYPFSNIFVLLHYPEKKTKERLEITLAEPDGKWTGKGNGGKYTHQILIKDQYRFTDTGTMTFKLEQNMRETPLKGIIACGLRIEPINH